MRERRITTYAQWCDGCTRTVCYGGRTRCNPCERERVNRTLLLLCAIILPLVLLFARAAQGQAPDSLQAARACWVEASWRLDDCAAIIGVVQRRAERAQVPFAKMLLDYSALDADTERAAFARTLPDGDAPEWNASVNARWSKLRAHADAVLAGRVADPCKGAFKADHFGSPYIRIDVERAARAGWRVVDCGHTANRFYSSGAR